MAADWKVYKTRSSGRQPSRQMMEDFSSGGPSARTNNRTPRLLETDGDKGINTKKRSAKEEILLQQNETQKKGMKDTGIQVYKAGARKTASTPTVNTSIVKAKVKVTARKSLPHALLPKKSPPTTAEKNSRSSSRRNILPIRFEFQKANSQNRRILVRNNPAAQNETGNIASPAPPQPQSELPKNTDDGQPKVLTAARKSAPYSRNTPKTKNTSPAQSQVMQNGLAQNTDDGQPKMLTAARKSAPYSRNTPKNKNTSPAQSQVIQNGVPQNTDDVQPKRLIAARKSAPYSRNTPKNKNTLPAQSQVIQNGVPQNTDDGQPKVLAAARKSAPYSRNTPKTISPAQSQVIQNGLPKSTNDGQPKVWITARKSAPYSRNSPINKNTTDVTDKDTGLQEACPAPKSPLNTMLENEQDSPVKTSPIQTPYDDAISNNAKENGDLSQQGFREVVDDGSFMPMRITRSLSPATLLQGVQRAAVLGLLKSKSLHANTIGQRSQEQAEINLNFRNKVSKAIAKNNSVAKLRSQTPESKSEDEADINMDDSADTSPDLAATSLDTSQAESQDVFDEYDPPKLISSKDLEALELSNNDETMGLERSPPDILPAEEVMQQQTYPPCGDQVTSDRDNPTPIPGTTASSLTPPHAQAADFPVGTAGSATPDSSAMESSPSDQRKKNKSKPRRNTHFGMKRHRNGKPGHKVNNYDSDSTDIQSETSGEQEPGSKKQRSSSSSTLASLESDAESTTTTEIINQQAISRHLQSELPLCCCRMEQDGPSSVTLNTCRALEVIGNELVECKNKINSNKLHRPSSRVPYGAFCVEHKTLMVDHKCCPGCGCFCNTGVVMVCNSDEKDKPQHHFHRECIYGISGTLYCPHCGDASNLREISIPSNGRINAMRKIPKSMIQSGIVKLPQSLVEKLVGSSEAEDENMLPKALEDLPVGPSARMSMTVKEKPTPVNVEDEFFTLPSKSITLKSGSIVTTQRLPPGPGRNVLESAMEYLHTETPKRIRFFPKNVYAASSEGDMAKVLQMLAEGFDPNYRFRSHNMESALHPAAANGNLEIIVILLQAGANIDAEDEDHKTPLMSAVESNHNDCMRYLIKHGATVQHKDDEGMTILHVAAKNGNLEAVKYITSLRKINPNSQDDGGWTPIIWAAEYKIIPVVQFLIERGADSNIRDKEGNSGLHWAVFSGADDVAEIFINRHGDVHAPNVHGDTPLHIAARENNYGCVTMLLLRNASIDVTNKEGETPVDCAKPDTDVSLALQVNRKMKVAIANRAIRTEKIISRDIARGLEALPITVVNAVNNDPIPTDFHYVAKSCETTPLNINHSIKQQPMCTCLNEDCSTDDCECANQSVQCWYDLDGLLFKDFDYHEPPLIFECGPGCRCLRTCRNRVVQNGIRCHLQLFRTSQMGWGVRVTQDIPQGTFICEYAGELISDAEADKREDDSYLFDLDNEEREVYCIDARYYGNVSRFINHLCDPNLVPVRVFIEHRDISFPRIAFFASRDIKSQEELGFDYGDKFWAIKSKFFRCCCGSVHCKHAEGSSGSSDPDS
ncbi:histone-lysine N-methyltransferase EHMT2-like [Asterias rubens]|uniref:histone-lysine N-methyltransferase EHMT2-like n=1 Tax=Asterias rubens TaxID=7604 RepID=UPI001455257F|nr:histone-lysine N-methyltransferase EHMT2-like [Asterias rubens]